MEKEAQYAISLAIKALLLIGILGVVTAAGFYLTDRDIKELKQQIKVLEKQSK